MLEDMPGERVRELGFELVKDLGRATSRRVTLTAGLLVKLSRGIADEAFAAAVAGREGRLTGHLDQRGQVAAGVVQKLADRVATSAGQFQLALKADPIDTLVHAFLFSMTALIASGGDDAALPDTHRSRMLHPFLVGAAAETLCLSVVRTINTSHRYLPHGHDPFWDAAASRCRPYADTLGRGLSADVAYHLLVDSLAPIVPLEIEPRVDAAMAAEAIAMPVRTRAWNRTLRRAVRPDPAARHASAMY